MRHVEDLEFPFSTLCCGCPYEVSFLVPFLEPKIGPQDFALAYMLNATYRTLLRAQQYGGPARCTACRRQRIDISFTALEPQPLSRGRVVFDMARMGDLA